MPPVQENNRISEASSRPALLRYHRRRPPVLRRGLILLLLAAIVAHQSWRRWGEPYMARSLTLYWQEQCLNYSLPPDRVAYVAAPKGLQLPSYLADFSMPPNTVWNGTIGAPPYPIELAEFQRRTNQAMLIWDELPSPIFLHGLTDPSGRERMVGVYAVANNPRGFWTLLAITQDPWTGRAPASQQSIIETTASWPLSNGEADTIVVFAGQADPKLRSRFTMRVRLNGTEQKITGTLQNDGKIAFSSSTGLIPWDTSRTGPIQQANPLPPPAQGYFDGERFLLPTD